MLPLNILRGKGLGTSTTPARVDSSILDLGNGRKIVAPANGPPPGEYDSTTKPSSEGASTKGCNPTRGEPFA